MKLIHQCGLLVEPHTAAGASQSNRNGSRSHFVMDRRCKHDLSRTFLLATLIGITYKSFNKWDSILCEIGRASREKEDERIREEYIYNILWRFPPNRPPRFSVLMMLLRSMIINKIPVEGKRAVERRAEIAGLVSPFSCSRDFFFLI